MSDDTHTTPGHPTAPPGDDRSSSPGGPLRLVSSASAATLSQVWRLGVTLATHFVLRRMIPPSEMGIWNWAEVLFILIAQVRDVGIPGHLVRVQRRPFGLFLRLQTFWGGLLAALVALTAPWLALLFESHDEQTVAILRVFCLFLFVQGLGSVPLTWYEAEQRLVSTIPAELARNTVFAALSLLLAWQGHGVWSLVIAHVVAAAVYSAVLWAKAWREIPPDPQKGQNGGEGLRELLRAGLPLAALSFLELAVLHLDPLLLGTVLPEEAVGEASLAIFALFFVSRLLADAVGRAVYPALVSLHHQRAQAYEVYSLATLLLVTFVVPVAFSLHLNAEWVAWFLGGDAWRGAAPYLRLAAFVPLVRPLTMFGREYLLVVHQDRVLILYTLTNLLSLGGIGWWLVQTDLEELGMAIAGYFPLGTLFLAWGLAQIDRAAFSHLLRRIAWLYVAALPLFAPVWWVPAERMWTRLGVSALVSLVYLGVAWWRYGEALRGFWRGDLLRASDSRNGNDDHTAETTT